MLGMLRLCWCVGHITGYNGVLGILEVTLVC